MAYQIGLDMGITEFAIIAAVKTLQVKRDSFSYDEIASAMQGSVPTVKRHMPKLIKAGKIRRIGAVRSRCRYEVIENA